MLNRHTQSLLQAVPGKNIIAKHHGYAVMTYKVRADQKRLGKPVRRGLYRIRQIDPYRFSVPQKLFKARSILRSRYYQYILYPRIH